MPCATWIRLQQQVAKAIEDLIRQQKSFSAGGPTAEQIATMRALQDALFKAIAAIQQHEKEHGCVSAASASQPAPRE
jgi:hypothetical protein